MAMMVDALKGILDGYAAYKTELGAFKAELEKDEETLKKDHYWMPLTEMRVALKKKKSELARQNFEYQGFPLADAKLFAQANKVDVYTDPFLKNLTLAAHIVCLKKETDDLLDSNLKKMKELSSRLNRPLAADRGIGKIVKELWVWPCRRYCDALKNRITNAMSFLWKGAKLTAAVITARYVVSPFQPTYHALTAGVATAITWVAISKVEAIAASRLCKKVKKQSSSQNASERKSSQPPKPA
jgi:hypothetical protein